MEVDFYVSSFKLGKLDESWVDSVWENEFISVDDLPPDYLKEEDFDVKILDFKGELKRILVSGSHDGNEPLKIWDSLGPHVRRLLPVLYYFIRQGRKDDADDENRVTCLNACSLYFILLSVPGSSAYKVFRRLLFEAALESFKLSSLLRDDTASKGKRRHEDTFEDTSESNLFYAQKYMLAEGLNGALLDLLCLLKSFSLKDKSDSFETTVQTITILTLVDNKSSQINFTNCQASNPSSHKKLEQLLQSLSFNAYVALSVLAKGRLQDGDMPCAELVLDNLLPALAWGGSDGSARERTTIRNNMKRFIRQCILPIAKEEGHFDTTMTTLVRHLCAAAVRMSAEIRRLVAGTILDLMADMPCILPILNWIIQFSRSERSNHRLMCMEVLGHMLLKSGTMKQLEEYLPKIIEALAARFRDISPSVCGRALNALAECCSLPSALEVIQRLFEREVPMKNQDSSEPPVTEGEVLLTELVERLSDIRAGVRRYALQVLANLLPACPISYRKPILLLLRHHCLDPSSMVRKIALLSLTNIICTPIPEPEDSEDFKTCIEDVEESWLRGVLPQICDRDVKVKEKALELTWNVLLLGKAVSGGMPNPNWHLIRRMETLRLLPFLSAACSSWAKEKSSLGKDLWPHIAKHLEGQHQYPAWVLLSTISEHCTIPDAIFIMNYYTRSSLVEDGGILEECTTILIMRVLGRVSIELSQDNVKQLETNLLDRISEFTLPPSVIRPTVDALYLMSRHASGVTASECSTFVPLWGAALIQACEQFILASLNSRGGLSSRRAGAYGRGVDKQQQVDAQGRDLEEEALVKHMLTLADVALVCPGVVKSSTIAAIQCILFPPPNARAGKRLRTPSPQLCSIAVVVLGKLCLQDARLAARVVPSLGSLLQRPPLTHPPPADPAWASLRNNVMCALSDMCRSFAQLVDPLLPRMSACLHASDKTLRENALVLLVQLLQEDYLKVRRGALLFDLLTALNDPEIAVSQLASYYLGRCLSHSQPSIMYQNILPALFHYNGYQGHEIYKVYGIEGGGSGGDTVFHGTSEEEQIAERRIIFRFMLQHITDDQRQKIIGKICREVLGGAVEGAVSLECGEGCQLLADGLWMLTTEEIRPNGLKGNEEETEEAEMAAEMAMVEEATSAGNEPSTSANAAQDSTTETPGKRKKNQFPGMQKEMLDVLLPITVSLMQRLERLKSPLLAHLMGFLLQTIKEYKIDVGELVSGDQQLSDDISRNVKTFEAQKN